MKPSVLDNSKLLKLFSGPKTDLKEWLNSVVQYHSTIENDNDLDFKTRIERFRTDYSINLSNARFPKAIDFSGLKFAAPVKFDRAEFVGGSDFSNTEFLDTASFKGTVFGLTNKITETGVSFHSAKFRSTANFGGATFLGFTKFNGIEVGTNLIMSSATFKKHGNFLGSNLPENSDFNCVKFENVGNFSGVNLSGASFVDSSLNEVDFSGCNLTAAKFNEASLVDADLSNVEFDTQTSLKNATVTGAKVDHFSLECLSEQGGLSTGDLMRMNIQNDAATMRFSFGGFQKWLHIFAVLTFAFPYVWFLLVHWREATFSPVPSGQESMTLIEALWRFIYSGGVEWRNKAPFHLSCVVFFFVLPYHFIRSILLWKTMHLEAVPAATGLPARFSLLSKPFGNTKRLKWLTWGHLKKIVDVGGWALLGLATLHTAHFLQMRIVIQ